MSDYTPADARRLLSAGISDDQACGYCHGECESCQLEAGEVIAQIKADALRGAAKGAAGPIDAATSLWLYSLADRIEGESNE